MNANVFTTTDTLSPPTSCNRRRPCSSTCGANVTKVIDAAL